MAELLQTEGRYAADLEQVLLHYRQARCGRERVNHFFVGCRDKLLISNHPETRRLATVAFGNLEQVHSFHANVLRPSLERCGANPASVARAFAASCAEMRRLYVDYCQNMPRARRAVADLGGEQAPTSVLVRCQREAGHPLPLSSYLLKPMQRLTKYQLLLADLKEASGVIAGKHELEQALQVSLSQGKLFAPPLTFPIQDLMSMIKVVNDSMAGDQEIRGLPDAVRPLGALNCKQIFQVSCDSGKMGHTISANGSANGGGGGQLLFGGRGRNQRRHVLLYDRHLVFCKPTSNSGGEKNAAGPTYQFKFAVAVSGLGMSSVVKGDEKKMELWINHGRGRESCYTLEAKTKKSKEEFAAELRKVIIRQNDDEGQRRQQQQHQQVYFDSSTSSDGQQLQQPLPSYYYGYALGGPGQARAVTASERQARLARSRSCDTSRQEAHALRSRSVDAAGEEEHGSHEEDDEQDVERGREGAKFVVLADYLALTNREIDLSEDEVVELIKVGCAGWWYVRLADHPHTEGWAPSTYLEPLGDRSDLFGGQQPHLSQVAVA